MTLKTFFYTLTIAFLFTSCNSNPEGKIEFIQGYWEIKEVKKNNRLIKEYTISSSIDYFKVNNDLTGFRKKVTPKFDGTFTITKDQVSFSLKIENDSLNIYYNDIITKETIIKANDKELIIVNPQDFTYIYKPYKSINIE